MFKTLIFGAHNSLGSGERCHALLKRIFFKIRKEHSKMDKDIILKLAVKAINSATKPKRVASSYLVFCCKPLFSSTESALRTQQQKMDAMQSDRREMAIITSELRKLNDLPSRVPRNTDFMIEVGGLLRIFRENDKRCVVPYPVICIDGTHMFIIDNHSKDKFIKYQVLPVTTYDNIISKEHLVYCCRNYRPIVHAILLLLIANRSQASSSQKFDITMTLKCEVCKLFAHEINK